MKRMMKILRVVGATGFVSAVLAYLVFRRQKYEAIQGLGKNSQMIDTAFGPVEFAVRGEGAAVLVCHGGGGGYDQGLFLAWPEAGFRFIAPSRPGYLRTPLETGRTFEGQADAYAALLDALGIHSVAVMGTSGGGPSALQFALRYPERCWGIVLLSAISLPIPAFPFVMQQVTEKIIPYFDFIPWLMFNTPLLFALIDRGTRAQIGGDAAKKAALRGLMRTMFPVSLRVAGAFNDVREIARMRPYQLEGVCAPALVIHGDRDTIVPFEQGQWSAGTIPNARLIPIKGGQHFSFITHHEIVRPAVRAFLRSHAPGRGSETS